MKKTFSYQNISMMALILSFFIIIGAEVFGHIVVGGIAFEEPPRSFSMFEGEYGYDSQSFWNTFPIITAVMFLIAIATNWKTNRRNLLLYAFGGFIIIGFVSANFIYPMFLELAANGYSDTFEPVLKEKANTFTTVGLIRLTATIGVGILLLTILTIPVISEDN